MRSFINFRLPGSGVRWALALLGFLLSFGIGAQEAYPKGPIKILVGTAAGGPTDAMARIVAERLSTKFKQAVVVENRPGAGQTIAAAMLARAPADGYTLFMCTQTFATNPAMFKSLPYDTVRDFEPVAFVASMPFGIFVNPKVPARTLQEFIDLAKSQPGKLNFGSSGLSSMPRLAGEIFKQRANVDIVHVPYGGSAPALLSLIANETQMMFSEFATPAQYLKNEQLRVLAITSDSRLPFAPDVPTTAEAGLPGLTMSVWFGVVARAGTPAHIVNLLNREINETMADPQIKARLARDGTEASKGLSPAEFKAYIASQMLELGNVVRDAKIPVQP